MIQYIKKDTNVTKGIHSTGNKKLKILYVIEDLSAGGGVETITVDKANGLATLYGHEVTIVSIYNDPRPRRTDILPAVNVKYLNVAMVRRNTGIFGKTIDRISIITMTTLRLNRIVARIQPNIILFATTLGAMLLPLCSTKAIKVFESHLARPFTPFKWILNIVERHADAIICITKADAANFDRARQVFVISNYLTYKPIFVENYGTKKAIAVGRLEHQKGFDLLIKAWQLIVSQHPDWTLDIFGEGPYHKQLQYQINEAELQNNIFLRGRSHNIRLDYAAHSLHLMTSRFEGMPITLIEAQSAGLPAVVFDFDYGAREIIKNGENGLIIPLGNIKGYANALHLMMSNEDMRRKCGTKARNHAFPTRSLTLHEWNMTLQRLCQEQ